MHRRTECLGPALSSMRRCMMKRHLSPLLAVALAAAVACQDSGDPAPTTSDTATLANAFASLPVGFSNVQSTFADSTNSEWTPGAESGQRGHHGGGRGGGPDGGDGMMCVGLGGLGGLGLGFGFGHDLT